MLAALALVLAQPSGDAGEAAIAAALDAAAAAWRAGDLESAGGHANEARRLIAASECPVRADAAIAGFMTGVAGRAFQIEDYDGLGFWTAVEVDRLMGGVLPENWRGLAQDRASQPGGSPAHDRHFLASPYYRASAPDRPCAPDRLDPFTLEPQGETSVLVAAIHLRWTDGGRIYDEDLVFGYPQEEAAAFARRRAAMRRPRGVGSQHLELHVLDPCTRVQNHDWQHVELCRE